MTPAQLATYRACRRDGWAALTAWDTALGRDHVRVRPRADAYRYWPGARKPSR